MLETLLLEVLQQVPDGELTPELIDHKYKLKIQVELSSTLAKLQNLDEDTTNALTTEEFLKHSASILILRALYEDIDLNQIMADIRVTYEEKGLVKPSPEVPPEG